MKRLGWFGPWALAAIVLCVGSIGGIAVLVREHFAVEAYARIAREAVASNGATAGQVAIDRWLKARPQSAEAHAVKAHMALIEGDLGQVTSELNQARSLGYPREKLERIHALSLARIGRYAEAEPILVGLYNSGAGGDPAVDEALARVYLMTYRLSDAEKTIKQWIRDAPADGRPFLWLTEYDRRLEVDGSESLERHFREALKRDPQLDRARLGLAETLRKVHRNTEAMTEYDVYLKRHPDDVAALAGAGLVALELNEMAMATDLLESAIKRDPANADALRGRAALEHLKHDFPAASATLDRVLQIDPYDTEGHYKRAQVRRQLGDADGAKKDLETFKRLTADNAEVLKLRAILMVDANNNEARSKVAAWMFSRGRDQDGLGWASAVLASDPNHVATNSLLADYYSRSGSNPGLSNFYRVRASSAQPMTP